MPATGMTLPVPDSIRERSTRPVPDPPVLVGYGLEPFADVNVSAQKAKSPYTVGIRLTRRPTSSSGAVDSIFCCRCCCCYPLTPFLLIRSSSIAYGLPVWGNPVLNLISCLCIFRRLRDEGTTSCSRMYIIICENRQSMHKQHKKFFNSDLLEELYSQNAEFVHRFICRQVSIHYLIHLL